MRLYLNKAKFIAISAVLLSLFITQSYAQLTKVTGTVKDKNTKQGLYSAVVSVKGSTTGTNTDLDGKFSLNVDLTNPQTLIISYLGYNKVEVQVSKNKTNIDVSLSENVVTSKEVTIQSSRLTEKQKEAPLTVESMDLISIKQTSASNFYEGLGQLKGVDLTSASIGFKIINTRGFNSTSPVRSLQLIDGVDNQAPGLNFSLGNFLGASELDVQKVDLVVGASSAFYGPNAFNGVISMQTRNPFNSPGLTVMSKVGERGLFETAIRYAMVYKNKAGEDKFAFKVNLFYMRAYDWEANNTDATPQSTVGRNNPGSYDAVNRYGDENFDPRGNNATSLSSRRIFPGLNVWHRDGYWEKDLVDYNTKNVKLGGAAHYKINSKTELIYSINFGTGTTVYQGDNRYSLKDILFYQNRLEIKNDKWFVRAYATHEDAGNSYDAVFTAQLMQNVAKDDFRWSGDYQTYWGGYIRKRAEALPGYPVNTFPDPFNFDSAAYILNLYKDSLVKWHQEARSFVNLGTSPTTSSPTGAIYQNSFTDTFNVNRFQPGTVEFDSALNAITSRVSYLENGSRFYDKSALYNIQAERKFNVDGFELVVGGSGRLYTPNSRGSIFSDTAGRKITNSEYGLYAGIEKRYLNDQLKLNATIRTDKNENFDRVYSPAASAVYTNKKGDVYRLSLTSAVRNPTLADQYIFFNVGRAILLGNTEGIDSLVTVPSLYDFFNSQKLDTLDYFSVDPVQPEKVRSIEFGYRTTLFNSLFLDASYYFSAYTDFIGFKVGVATEIDTALKRVYRAQAYRVSANAKDVVYTQGFSVGLTYFFKNFYSLTGNYSWNILDLRGSDDEIIPAFNTPEHKFNIGISARDIDRYVGPVHLKDWSFSLNYKWIQGFVFEGSPQFTGYVPTYDLFDAQVSKSIPKINTTFKLGASNLFNKKNIQVYGGPYVGRLAYFSVTYDLAKNK
jgi:outer membrane receptor protein involved in Fe transport